MLWLATDEGVCSFDGKKFTSFSSEMQVSKPGSNLLEDKYGRIWYCSFDGSIYYIEKGTLHSLAGQKPLGYQKFSILNNLFIYYEDNKLVFLDLKSLKTLKTMYIPTEYLISTHTFKNAFYLYGKDFFYEIRGINNIKNINVPNTFKTNFSVGILTNSADKLLLVSKYSNKYSLYWDGIFKEYNFNSDIKFIQNGKYTGKNIWLSTTKGLVKLDNANLSNTKGYFENFNISTIFNDKEGNHWIGTLGKGLLLVPNFDTYLIPTPNSPSKLKTYNNKLLYSTQNDRIYSSIDSKESFDFQEIYNGKSNHTIDQLEIDSLHQKIYFTSNVFKTSDLKGNVSKEKLFATKEFIPIDSKYYAYVSSGTCGLFKVSEDKSDWDKVFNSNRILYEIDNCFSAIVDLVRGKSAAYNSDNNTIYFATNKGLFAINKEKKGTVLWKSKLLNLTKIVYFNSVIYGLTTNNELVTIDVKNNVKPLKLSIEDNDFKKIKLIKSSLYLFTNNCIFKFNLAKNTLRKVFNQNAENEISDIVEFENNYLLASAKGLIRVDANDLKQNCMPKFLLQQVLVNGKKSSIKNLKNLKSKQNSIEIQYAVISFIPNLKNVLYYKINSGKWQTIDDESRSFKLSSLASGDYKIHFKTAYNNKFSDVQTISITIEKPFTESIWFYLLVLALLVFVLHLFYRFQIRKIKQRNQLLLDKIELEKSLNQSTLKAIKSQMNPHFFYNALNTIQSYILSNDKKQAVSYLSKFSSLTRTILEMSEKETITVAEEIKTLSLYLDIEKARFNDDFEYEIKIPKNSEIENLKMPSLLLQPYVENAIKHGLLHKTGAKNLTISFNVNHKFLEILIADNGIGRKKSEELKKLRKNPHQSFATEAMQKKIDLLNKHKISKISIEIIDEYSAQNIAQGTTVFFKIPLDFYYT